MTLAEIAQYLGCHRRTIERWRAKGNGPPGYQVGGCVRYRRRDVEEWLEANRVTTSR